VRPAMPNPLDKVLESTIYMQQAYGDLYKQ
jgi:hypothetical protein